MDHKSFYTCLVLLLEIFLESFASPPAPRKLKPRGDDVEKHPAFHFISLLSCFQFLKYFSIDWRAKDLQNCCMIISKLRPERHGQNKSTRTQIQIENVEK
jgi:hypothetical protein